MDPLKMGMPLAKCFERFAAGDVDSVGAGFGVVLGTGGIYGAVQPAVAH